MDFTQAGQCPYQLNLAYLFTIKKCTNFIVFYDMLYLHYMMISWCNIDSNGQCHPSYVEYWSSLSVHYQSFRYIFVYICVNRKWWQGNFFYCNAKFQTTEIVAQNVYIPKLYILFYYCQCWSKIMHTYGYYSMKNENCSKKRLHSNYYYRA